jgi:hypothetical protein
MVLWSSNREIGRSLDVEEAEAKACLAAITTNTQT